MATTSSLILFPISSTTEQVVSYYADIYQVSAEEMINTLWCESDMNPKAVGDHGHSYGLSQIYLDYHKEVTKKQALDPVFSIKFMAKAFSEGHKRWWTCARTLGYRDLPTDPSFARKKEVLN